jgi:hypothetical protein
LSRSLTTVSGTKVVKTCANSDAKAMNVAEVGKSLLNATLVWNTEECDVTRNCVQRTNLDVIASLYGDGSKGTITQAVFFIDG